MKKLIYLYLALMMFPVHADTLELTVLTENFPPYNFEENGKITGFTTEIVEAILKETGNEHVSITLFPWQRAYKQALEEPNVLLFTMTKTEQRTPKFKWVGPVAPRSQCLWKLKARTDINIETLDDAKRYSISVVPDSAVHQYLVEQGFTDKQLHLIHDGNLSLRKFLVGRDDLVLDSKFSMAYRLKLEKKGMELVEPVLAMPNIGDYYLAFSLDTPDSTVSLFQKTLDKMKSDGTYEQIWQRYMRLD